MSHIAWLILAVLATFCHLPLPTGACDMLPVPIGRSTANTKSIEHDVPITWCPAECGRDCRFNVDESHASDAFEISLRNGQLTVQRQDAIGGWDMELTIPCCTGCPSRIYNDSRLTIGALYLDIFPIQDQAQCCKRCEANPDCDIWAFPNSRICSLMSLRAKTEVQYVVDPGSTFGLILGRKAGVAAWSNVVPLPPVICHDWQDRMQAFFTKEKCVDELRGLWLPRTPENGFRYGECTDLSGTFSHSTELASSVCGPTACSQPMRWQQGTVHSSPGMGWCIATVAQVEHDWQSAINGGRLGEGCLRDGVIVRQSFRYVVNKRKPSDSGMLCQRYIYTDCCPDRPGFDGTVTPSSAGDEGIFDPDFQVPDLISYAIMGSFFFFWNSMLAFGLMGKTVAGFFFLDWNQQSCTACICPHWVVGIAVPYLVGGLPLALAVCSPYYVAIPRACIQMAREGHPFCPAVRSLAGRMRGQGRANADAASPTQPRAPHAPPAGPSAPAYSGSDFASDVEINVAADTEEMARLHSGLECCICLDPYKDEVMASCGHSFCSACITAVLRSNPPQNNGLCPLCRCEIRLRDLRIVKRNVSLCEEMQGVRTQSVCDDLSSPVVRQSRDRAAAEPMFIDVQTEFEYADANNMSLDVEDEAFTEGVLGAAVGGRLHITANGTLPAGQWSASFHVKLIGTPAQDSLALSLELYLNEERVLIRQVQIPQALELNAWRHLVIGTVDVPSDGTPFNASLKAQASDQPQPWYSTLLIDCLVLAPAHMGLGDPPAGAGEGSPSGQSGPSASRPVAAE
uniref:RING-type domain-containing protein n=1 Tax=Eutreptiella gymnastica TaxID=73025 RepID=A0A7S4CEV6_9EUGL